MLNNKRRLTRAITDIATLESLSIQVESVNKHDGLDKCSKEIVHSLLTVMTSSNSLKLDTLSVEEISNVEVTNRITDVLAELNVIKEELEV